MFLERPRIQEAARSQELHSMDFQSRLQHVLGQLVWSGLDAAFSSV